jgi:aminotransferase in exopolysaccharide biosynthesis
MISLSVPSLKGNELKYVKECLDREWISSVGQYVDTFEHDVADYLGARHAIACVNGTAALHISLLLAGVKPDDEVIVPTITFIAPVNTVTYLGAQPVFMDCDRYCTLDTDKVREFIETECQFDHGVTMNKKTGRRIAAIIPVHVFGTPVDMDPLLQLAEKHNLAVIEDASESLGSDYKGKKTGTLGTLGCLSFNGNKIITTGAGGMIITNDESMAKKAKYLTTQAKEEGIEYIHNEVGHNYRLANVLAAIGVAQMETLETYIAIKRRNFDLYKALLSDTDYTLLDDPPYGQTNKWFYAALCKHKEERKLLLEHLSSKGIQARPLWFLNHLQKPYKHCEAYRIDTSPDLYDRLVNIPCSVSLTEREIREVVAAMKEILSHQSIKKLSV